MQQTLAAGVARGADSSPQPDDLIRRARALNGHHVKCVLIGGFAVLTHGGPRTIKRPHFADDGAGGTLIRDLFGYAAPLGVPGWPAERLFMTRYMRRFLAARNREVKTVAESAAGKECLPLGTED